MKSVPASFCAPSVYLTKSHIRCNRTCRRPWRTSISCQQNPTLPGSVRESLSKPDSQTRLRAENGTQVSIPQVVVSNPVPGHNDWKYAGPPLEYGPLPAIIYLSLTAEQSLELDPFNQFVHFLSPSAQSSFRVFSVTLPFHTSDMMENEAAFEKWADTYKAGGDLVSGFVRKVNAALDKFIDFGFVSSQRIYVAGLSRGGLLAAHVAAANKNVQACLGFAPVTVLHYLEEFADFDIFSERAQQKIYRASLLHDCVVRGLISIPLRFYMGNSDTRVGTKNAFEFVHLLAERSAQNGVRSPPHEFIMYCRDVFRAGAEYMLSQLDASPQILSE
ncbi:Prolyl oligopeptidase [Gracilaria domingensis]|nr:Prolyl oligopeptidase [Gracilaria domingensis]